MDSADPEHLNLLPTATLVGVSPDQCVVELAVAFPSEAVSKYGAPAAVGVRYLCDEVHWLLVCRHVGMCGCALVHT